jgi:hypothetical protein
MIERAKNRVSRRLRQYWEDARYHAANPAKRMDYYNQLVNRQRNLRKLLFEWLSNNCGGPGGPNDGLPSGVWQLATVRAPSPASVAATMGGVAVTGTFLWWLFKLASPACGPAAPACAIAF